MRRLAVSPVVAGLLAALGSAPAAAVDNPIPVKIFLNKSGTKTKFVSKPGSVTLPDPNTTIGAPATLTFIQGSGAADAITLVTPAKGLGSPAGTKGFKWKDPSGATCKVVLLKPTVVKGLCRASAVGQPPDPNSAIGIVLNAGGENFCGECAPGTVKGNPDKITKRKDCPAPLVCASTAGCGNGVIDPGETCDDGNTNDDGPCPADCVVDPCTPNTGTNFQVTVTFDPPGNPPSEAGVAGLTMLLDYPEGLVSIPGTAGYAPAFGTVSTADVVTLQGSLAVNDFDHAIRLAQASSGNLTPPNAIHIFFETCQGKPAPTPANFRCDMIEASDSQGNVVPNTTCSVTIP